MRIAHIAALFLLLAGCGRVPQTHYFSFELDPPAPAAASGAVLWVEPFSALPACDQDRMVFRDSAWEIQFDAYRRWITPPPGLLYERLVEYLRASGHFTAVVTAPPRRASFQQLAVQVQRFDEENYDGKRRAVIKLWFELGDGTGEILKSGYIEGSAPVVAGGIETVVAAMRAASAQAFAELLNRL
jgi:ABC-type uncharacterized transport system auxiliary subunit